MNEDEILQNDIADLQKAKELNLGKFNQYRSYTESLKKIKAVKKKNSFNKQNNSNLKETLFINEDLNTSRNSIFGSDIG